MSDLIVEKKTEEDKEIIKLINEWGDDIKHIFPHFEEEEMEFSNIFLLNYENKNAGIFIYQHKGEELHIHVDYLIPEFRNLGVGKKFFNEKISVFSKSGYKTLVSLTDNRTHIKYLKSIGFILSNNHPDRYELSL